MKSNKDSEPQNNSASGNRREGNGRVAMVKVNMVCVGRRFFIL
jgi:hypothetical protein